MSVVDLVEGIWVKMFLLVEVVFLVVECIWSVNLKFNVIVYDYGEKVFIFVVEVDFVLVDGIIMGFLYGVFVIIKINVDVEGMLNINGMKVFENVIVFGNLFIV